MKRWRIFSIGATDICIHPAILTYALYAWITGHLMFLLLAMASIALHEISHAVVSALCGQNPASIEITPLGAVMRLEDESKLPAGKRLLVLIAGPAATALLCHLSLWLTARGTLPAEYGRMLFMSNLSILLLNMLPVLPLDGGRLLALLMGMLMPQSVVARVMRCIGSIVGFGMILLNIAASWKYGGWNLSLAFTGCCIIYSAALSATTHAMTELRYFIDRKIALERKRCCKLAGYTALHTDSIRQLVRLLPPGKMAMFACVEAGSMRLLGWLPENDVIQRYLENPNMRFADALARSQIPPNREKSGTN